MPKKIWNYNLVELEALKYKTRNEFQRKSSGAYGYASKHKILDNVCKHMIIIGDKYNRFIYKIIFPRINSIYIGLTYNFDERKNSHMTNSSNKYVRELLGKNEEHFWICERELIKQNYIGSVEKSLISEFKKSGWNVLNISDGGGLGGGSYKWTKLLVENEAKKYSNRGDFRLQSNGAYCFAHRHGLLDDICKHMKAKWSLDVVKDVAINFSSRSEFMIKAKGAYYYAYRNNFLDKICEHMNK